MRRAEGGKMRTGQRGNEREEGGEGTSERRVEGRTNKKRTERE
jgi:hypothetical protein